MDESVELLIVSQHPVYGEQLRKAESEIEAFRKYKALGNIQKSIVRAKVFRQNIIGTSFIMKYEVLETIA